MRRREFFGIAASLMGVDYRMGSSRQLKLLPPERIKQIGLDNISELVRNSFTYLLPDRLDKYVEAWAEVKAA